MITHKTEEFDLERFWTIESLGITPTINDQKEDPLLEYQETSITQKKDYQRLKKPRRLSLRSEENQFEKLPRKQRDN